MNIIFDHRERRNLRSLMFIYCNKKQPSGNSPEGCLYSQIYVDLLIFPEFPVRNKHSRHVFCNNAYPEAPAVPVSHPD